MTDRLSVCSVCLPVRPHWPGKSSSTNSKGNSHRANPCCCCNPKLHCSAGNASDWFDAISGARISERVGEELSILSCERRRPSILSRLSREDHYHCVPKKTIVLAAVTCAPCHWVIFQVPATLRTAWTAWTACNRPLFLTVTMASLSCLGRSWISHESVGCGFE